MARVFVLVGVRLGDPSIISRVAVALSLLARTKAVARASAVPANSTRRVNVLMLSSVATTAANVGVRVLVFVNVLDGVRVFVNVLEGVNVRVFVFVNVLEGVNVRVFVLEFVGVDVVVLEFVGVNVGVSEAVNVGPPGVTLLVLVSDSVGVGVSVAVAVSLGVGVSDGVGVSPMLKPDTATGALRVSSELSPT
jgi:hypothetical protein